MSVRPYVRREFLGSTRLRRAPEKPIECENIMNRPSGSPHRVDCNPEEGPKVFSLPPPYGTA